MTDDEVLKAAKEIKKERRSKKREAVKKLNANEIIYSDIERIKNRQNVAILEGNTEELIQLDKALTDRIDQLIKLSELKATVNTDIGVVGSILGIEYFSRVNLPDRLMRLVRMFLR